MESHPPCLPFFVNSSTLRSPDKQDRRIERNAEDASPPQFKRLKITMVLSTVQRERIKCAQHFNVIFRYSPFFS